jgi:hypothetical protein
MATPVLQRRKSLTSSKFSSKTADALIRKFFTAIAPVSRVVEVRVTHEDPVSSTA